MKLLTMIIGIGMALAGILTPGLWPWQLPASVIGGLIFMIALMSFIDSKTKNETK